MTAHSSYDTNQVSEADRFSYWREAVCESYVQLGCETENRRDFKGSIDIMRHRNLSISRVSGQAHRADRRPSDIRRATNPYFLLSLQTARTSSVTQFGKTAILQPGDMALYCSADPYSLRLSENFSQTVVQLPAEKLLSRLPNAHMLTAQRVDGQSGLGKLVRDNILAFCDHANTSNATVQALIQDTLIDLIATGLAAHAHEKIELSSPEQHVMMRAKVFIRSNLGNEDLDRNLLAAEMGMSVRRLSEIFAKEEETIAGFIRKQRLDRVASCLRDPRYVGRSISEIAFESGFSNMQNFSTLFRSHFNDTPRTYRLMHQNSTANNH